jgi:hypothetical protein
LPKSLGPGEKFSRPFSYVLLLWLRQIYSLSRGHLDSQLLSSRALLKPVLMVGLYGGSLLTRLNILRDQGLAPGEAHWAEKILQLALDRSLPERTQLRNLSTQLAALRRPLLWRQGQDYWCFLPGELSGPSAQRWEFRLTSSPGRSRKFLYVYGGGRLSARRLRNGLAAHLAHLGDAYVLKVFLDQWPWGNVVTIHDCVYHIPVYRSLLSQIFFQGYTRALERNILRDLSRTYLGEAFFQYSERPMKELSPAGNFLS